MKLIYSLGLGQYLISSRPLKIYHPSAIITTYIITIMLISIAPIALYMYGYGKYFVSYLWNFFEIFDNKNSMHAMNSL